MGTIWLSTKGLGSRNNTKVKPIDVSFIAAHASDMSYKELAEALGVSITKIRSEIHKNKISYTLKKPATHIKKEPF